jgi:hypothetical protein
MKSTTRATGTTPNLWTEAFGEGKTIAENRTIRGIIIDRALVNPGQNPSTIAFKPARIGSL